jgi:hypothetical protein
MPSQSNIGGIYGIGTGSTSTGNQITIYPPTTATGTSSGGAWYTRIRTCPAYVLLKLPINKIPDMVFLNGKAITVGIFGSKAECAFGLHDLIFAGKMFASLPIIDYSGQTPRYTLILQYKTKTYHYCAELDEFGSYIALREGTNIIKAELISEIKRV